MDTDDETVTFEDLGLDDDTLKELTYSADGKTLNERLSIHYDNAIEKNSNNERIMYLYNKAIKKRGINMKYTSAEAGKLLKKLNDERASLLLREENSKDFLAASFVCLCNFQVINQQFVC